MNILFICSANAWGGNEKWTSMAMQGLLEKHQVYFLGRNPQLLDKFGKVTQSFTAPFTWNFDVESLKMIEHIVREKKIDVIVSTKKKEYFLAGLISRKYKIKHIIRLGIVRNMKFPYWSKLVYYKLNDGIIVNAQKIKDNLMKYPYFMDHPIKVIYNGIPEFDKKNRQESSGKFKIVSTGMLTNRKGFHILIEAISMLSNNLKDSLALFIIGTGREEERLKKMVHQLKLENIIKFEGFSNNPLPYLFDADLFALISGNEGISNAIIEAMMCGVPCLTTDAGGAAEFINNEVNGYITERNVAAVAKCLENILKMEKSELTNIGSKGQEKVNSLFNVNKMNQAIADFICG